MQDIPIRFLAVVASASGHVVVFLPLPYFHLTLLTPLIVQELPHCPLDAGLGFIAKYNMARHRSSIAWLLLISSLLSCPLLLLALPANSIAPSADSTSTSSKYTDINFTSSFRSPVILTKSQLKDLKNDPLSAFLEHHSSHLRLDYGDLEAADVADGTLWALQWLPDLRLSQRIHQVTVEGYGSLTNFTAVASGLSQIERLEELHWLSQSPGATIDNLDH